VASGDRFGFGDNWASFLDTVDERRIGAAVDSVSRLLGRRTLEGASFLDLGSGSGLFSLAAHRLGAARVHSLDYDPASVATTRAMRERFAPDAGTTWTVEQGDVLDVDAMTALGTWDVVYSWGVLHHTGAMWSALDNAAARVGDGGELAIAIYNDQGGASRRWAGVKRTYHRVPARLRPAYVAAIMAPHEARAAVATTLHGGNYLRTWTADRSRGMSRWHDLVDWVGGYPFEVARPEEVFAFLRERGFRLEALKTCRGGLGCNEFRFTRVAAS
jgi:2-polyprenyl-3-methyl-5-hydroxy-6-metoxy-1,4-benzoquinol methylase